MIDINNLGDGTTYLRNPHLAKIARRLHLLEKLGTGIRLIFDECHKSGLKKTRYVEDGDYVKLIFEFSRDVCQSVDSEESVLKLFVMHNEVSVSDVMKLLDVLRNTATRKLNALIAKNLVKRYGKGPSVRYIRS